MFLIQVEVILFLGKKKDKEKERKKKDKIHCFLHNKMCSGSLKEFHIYDRDPP